MHLPQRNITCLWLPDPETPNPGRHHPQKAPLVFLPAPPPQPHTPTAFLLVFAIRGPSWESLSCHHLEPDRCGLPVSPDSTDFAVVPCFSGAYHNAWRKVGAQQVFVTWWSPSPSSKAHFYSPAQPQPSVGHTGAVPALRDACLPFPPDPS